MIGKRLAESRKRVGLSQHRLAVELGERYSQPMISMVESDRKALRFDGMVQAARILEISTDYLAGLTDDPTPVDDRVRDEEARRGELEADLERMRAQAQRSEAELDRLQALPDPDVSPIQSAPGWHDEDYESVRHYESEDVGLAAGTGTFADQEPVPSEVKFRTSWLREHHLRAKDLFLVDVSGNSMEPTICDGDVALVDETHTSPRSGKIYALRTGDGPLVKRVRKRDHRWWADSDNEEYEPQPLDDRARIMGRVVWWAHTDLR